MKRMATLAVLLLAATCCRAQHSDWRSVEQVAPDTEIRVLRVHGHAVNCTMTGADDQTLRCVKEFRFIGRGFDFVFARADVRAVLIRHHDGNRALTILLVGALLTAGGGVEGLIVAIPICAAIYFAGGSLPLIPTTEIYRAPQLPSPATTPGAEP